MHQVMKLNIPLPLQTILNSLFFDDILSDYLWGWQV